MNKINWYTEEMFFKELDEVWNPPRLMSPQRPQLPPLKTLLDKVKRPTKSTTGE